MSAVEEEYEKQRRHAYHQSALSQQEETGETTEILRALSEINDLPIDPESDPVMGQLVSKLSSTANLTSEQVRSNEWIREYLLVLYLCQFPTQDGMTGAWSGWVHGSSKAEREPLDPDKRMMLEAFVSTTKLALTRSEDFEAVKESTRNVTESVVHDANGKSGKGGILGRLRS